MLNKRTLRSYRLYLYKQQKYSNVTIIQKILCFVIITKTKKQFFKIINKLRNLKKKFLNKLQTLPLFPR